jgi:hypothetical protein
VGIEQGGAHARRRQQQPASCSSRSSPNRPRPPPSEAGASCPLLNHCQKRAPFSPLSASSSLSISAYASCRAGSNKEWGRAAQDRGGWAALGRVAQESNCRPQQQSASRRSSVQPQITPSPSMPPSSGTHRQELVALIQGGRHKLAANGGIVGHPLAKLQQEGAGQGQGSQGGRQGDEDTWPQSERVGPMLHHPFSTPPPF